MYWESLLLFKSLFESFTRTASLEAAEHRLAQGKGAWLSGVWGPARAFVAASLLTRLRRPLVLVCVDEAGALDVAEELRFFLQGFPSLSSPEQLTDFHVKYPTVLDPGSDPLVYFPALEYSAVDPVNREHGIHIERLLILKRLALGEPLVMVTSLPALLQRQLAPEAMIGASLSLKKGAAYSLQELSGRLVDLGYRREAAVEEPGRTPMTRA